MYCTKNTYEVNQIYFTFLYIRIYIVYNIIHMKKTGDIWEIIAIEYLQKKGYSIRDTNFKFGRFWEVDIIAQKWDITYFIEIKYRSHLWYWYPEESITPKKLYNCRKTVEYFCARNSISLENIEFHVITILKWVTSHRITHYKNVEI